LHTNILRTNIKYAVFSYNSNSYIKDNNLNCSEKEDNWKSTIALGSIQKVREEIVSLNQQWSKIKDRVYIFIQTGASHTECKYILKFTSLILILNTFFFVSKKNDYVF